MHGIGLFCLKDLLLLLPTFNLFNKLGLSALLGSTREVGTSWDTSRVLLVSALCVDQTGASIPGLLFRLK